MEIDRKRFQGVVNILSFNRHFYVIGLAVLALVVASSLLFNLPSFLLWTIVGAFSYGLLMPLIVSAYIYDFSKYYNFDWLSKYGINDAEGNKFVNINAGFDETSFIIKNIFPKSELEVFDFYDSKRHTESAIVRARKVSLVYPKTKQIKYDLIPLKDKSVDVVFLLSAAHEIRSNEEKKKFLKECHRICKANGKVIMVEHLRDLPNFLAFSVGFTHFFSKKVWERAFKNVQFSSFEEQKFTPFMSIFNVGK